MKINTVCKKLCLIMCAMVALSHVVSAAPALEEPKQKATLKLAGIFGSNMVLQRNSNVPFWGWAKPNEQVSLKVSWSETIVTTIADKDGKWKMQIRTPEAGEGLSVTVRCSDESVTLKNVLSGEVWICSGQSNMQWKMRGFGPDHFKEEVTKATFPNIRFCNVPQVLALTEQDDVKTQWAVCNPQTVLNFSAVGYFFGSRLHQELNVPIGLISTNWGGSAIEGWISPEVLEKKLPAYEQLTKNYPKWIKESGLTYGRFNKAKTPKGLNQSSPSVLYNSMLKPIMPFSFQGVIWYQGESNVRRPMEYRALFPAMLRDWRKRWGIGNFAFYYVQIAPFAYKREPYPAAMLREAQAMALSEPHTGMAVTMDVGDETNIHPKDKKPVGERLALLALKNDYGKTELVDSGPQYESFRIEENKIRLKLNSVGGGLVAKGGGELTHFTIAGKGKKFVPAKAVIDGDTIVVSSDAVIDPLSVRFGWGNADRPNLMNKEGLPASSFRTDDWAIQEQSR